MRAAVLGAPPASSARARPLARAPGEAEGAGGGTPLRGSAADWLAGGMTSRAPFPRRPSPGRRVPQRNGGAAVRGAVRPCRDSGDGCGEAGRLARREGAAPSPRLLVQQSSERGRARAGRPGRSQLRHWPGRAGRGGGLEGGGGVASQGVAAGRRCSALQEEGRCCEHYLRGRRRHLRSLTVLHP